MPRTDSSITQGNRRQVICLVLLAGLLSACQTASDVGVGSTPVVAAVPASPTATSGQASSRPAGGSRTVLVPAYRVSFQQTVRVSATASPLLGRGVARASQHTALVGVPPDVYQRLVDRAHADFLAKARAAPDCA